MTKGYSQLERYWLRYAQLVTDLDKAKLTKREDDLMFLVVELGCLLENISPDASDRDLRDSIGRTLSEYDFAKWSKKFNERQRALERSAVSERTPDSDGRITMLQAEYELLFDLAAPLYCDGPAADLPARGVVEGKVRLPEQEWKLLLHEARQNSPEMLAVERC
ncbi:hypothetical protein IHQ68_03355 [Chelatococcus sambhunathii]|uniref:Uncharacterized protein n=1 Tax=Chelatococcus sambhunathii TaxID=363953 RepID=A0ABU1DC93_9HYPH|nr:hypothetical protein [Chelatococcus sambhunathii]MDR4305659.1 hypothetical protein [Chelatococcus sambhunathii]